MISVIIPVYNESSILEASLEKLAHYLPEVGQEFEVVVVSNGSTDGTDRIGLDLMKRWPWLKFEILPQRGVGRAFQKAVEVARGEFLIAQDIDLATDLVFIRHALALLQFSEMVIGSKTLGIQKRKFLRVFGSQLYIFIAQVALGLPFTDFSIAAKAYRRSAVLPALPFLDLWTGFVLDLALFLKCHGKTVIQIGVDCNDTRKSKFSLTHEALYRYRHLYHSMKLLQQPDSWIHRG